MPDANSTRSETAGGRARRARDCPVDHVSMTPTTVGVIEVDECPQCQGVWFQNDELRLTKDATDPDLVWLDFDIWKHPDRFQADRHHLACPDDGTAMVEVRYADTPVVVHYCPACRGIWLGRGDFFRIIAALEEEVVSKDAGEYVRASLRQARELLTGSESFASEWRDFLSVIHLLRLRFFAEHDGLAQAIRRIPRIG